MLKKVKVGKNTKECFTEMSENRKMQNGLGSQMMQLDSPEFQKSAEEIRSGYGKTTLHKIAEQDDFMCTFIWAVLLSTSSATLDSASLHFFHPLARSATTSA